MTATSARFLKDIWDDEVASAQDEPDLLRYRSGKHSAIRVRNARAILFLATPQTRCTTGHLLPVDGRLPEAFLR